MACAVAAAALPSTEHPFVAAQDKELGGLTGGWAGGEVGLKVKPDAFPVNSRVKVKVCVWCPTSIVLDGH